MCDNMINALPHACGVNARLVYATYCVPELSGKNTRYVLNRMMYQMGRNARLKPDKFRNKRHFKAVGEHWRR